MGRWVILEEHTYSFGDTNVRHPPRMPGGCLTLAVFAYIV